MRLLSRSLYLHTLHVPAVLRNRNRRNHIILTQSEPEPHLALGSGSGSYHKNGVNFYCRYAVTKRVDTGIVPSEQISEGTLADPGMKLAREEKQGEQQKLLP
jgi:hypothetical protein